MKTLIFDLLYLISSILRVFCTFLFFESFLRSPKVRWRAFGYIFFYIIISFEYLFLDIPIVTILLNLVGLFLLTLFYFGDLKRKVLATVFIYLISLFSESISLLYDQYFDLSLFKQGNYSSYVGVIISPIITFIFVIIYRHHKNTQNAVYLPTRYWLAVLLVPVSCITMMFIISTVLINPWQFISVEIILFTITISVFLITEKQVSFFIQEAEAKAIKTQNLYYLKQFDEIKKSNETIRSIQHDMNNHFLALQALAEKDKSEDIYQYISNLKDDLSENKSIDSGNPTIDSILSAKISAAIKSGKTMSVSIQIPDNLAIDDVDITILLGNLLDNALDHSSGDIHVLIRYTSGRLLLLCENPIGFTPIKDKRFFKSSKENSALHGYGLLNMQRIASKYSGEVNCSVENEIFVTRILLYLSDSI